MAESEYAGGVSTGAADYDVAIVGASVAGCTAAALLGRAGAKVALIESHGDPLTFKRACTHFIQSSGIPTLERLGLMETVEQAGAKPSDMNMWTRYGWISVSREDLKPPASRYPGWNIRRETLDPLLRELAAETPGVELMLGHTVDALVRDGERVGGVVARTRDGAELSLRTKLVVAADGRDSEIAKLANEPARQKPHNRFGYWAYYRDTPLATGTGAQLWMLDPDMAYAFPTDGGLTLLACMPHKRRLAEFKADPEGAMARLFETLPDGPRVDPAKRESKVLGKLNVPNTTRRPARPGLAFVGDAALAADPLWGVGVGWALQSAEWLADALDSALAGSDARIDEALLAYAARHRASLEGHEKFCSAYSTGKRFNPAEKLLFRAAARDRQLAARMALMGSRWITPEKMMNAKTLARIVRVNLRRGLHPTGLRTTSQPAPVAVAG